MRDVAEFRGLFSDPDEAKRVAAEYEANTWGYFGRAKLILCPEGVEVWGSRSNTCD